MINCPAALNPPERDWDVYLRLPADQQGPAALARFKQWKQKAHIRRVEVSAGSLQTLLSHLEPGVRVLVEVAQESDLEALEALGAGLPARYEHKAINLWVQLGKHSAAQPQQGLELVRRASLAGWPVLLPPLPSVIDPQPGFLLDLLDHYLFTPELTVPIEPLHSLLVSRLQSTEAKRSLWNMWFGQPLYHFYVSSAGAVSLSAQWTAQQAYRYGSLAQGPQCWMGSAGYEHARTWFADFPAGATAARCAGCDHNKLCGGVLLALEPETSCEAWIEVFERMQIAGRFLSRRSERARARKRGRRPGKGDRPSDKPKRVDDSRKSQ
jgi:hypothetical protein